MHGCGICGLAKADSDFYFNKQRQMYSSQCKDCQKAQARLWYKNNSQRAKDRNREWCRANRNKVKSYALRQRFGLSVEEYDRLLELQGGVCAICQKPNGKTLCVDHDHATNAIRGLLCGRCNVYLGMYEAYPEFAAEAEGYLKSKPASTRIYKKSGRPKVVHVKRENREDVIPNERSEPETVEENVPKCPEDGDPLVWNKVLKRWECECGYRGKVQRS